MKLFASIALACALIFSSIFTGCNSVGVTNAGPGFYPYAQIFTEQEMLVSGFLHQLDHTYWTRNYDLELYKDSTTGQFDVYHGGDLLVTFRGTTVSFDGHPSISAVTTPIYIGGYPVSPTYGFDGLGNPFFYYTFFADNSGYWSGTIPGYGRVVDPWFNVTYDPSSKLQVYNSFHNGTSDGGWIIAPDPYWGNLYYGQFTISYTTDLWTGKINKAHVSQTVYTTPTP